MAKHSHHIAAPERNIRAMLGPTNTGKTHYAVERMLAHSSGMMGFPLRLLAREIYDRVVAIKGQTQVALITGEERITPEQARYFICTVESMPVTRPVDFLAVDEIQLAADPQRGHIFTERLLRARGMHETMFMGADTIAPRIRSLLPDAEIISRPRFSELSYTKPRKLSRLPRRTAVVAFTAEDVYGLAELIRRQRGGTAIVMGSLSPKTRNAQAELYQSGEVDYLVATDAIGMGLNLDIDHVVFAQTAKFDGRTFRQLRADEIGQIAGRAGRHMNNGSYSILADSDAFLDEGVIERVEEHDFKKLKHLMWRNPERDFSSARALLKSLQQTSKRDELVRAPESADLACLKAILKEPEFADWASNPEATRLLWDACQIPDFQKISFRNHLGLVRRVTDFLRSPAGVIDNDWIGKNIARLDNVQGDIETIAGRLAAIRIWTYISHKKNWLQDSAYWAYQSRAVEDKLSDALHQGLTQRFVDRRTAVLMRELKQKGDLLVAIKDDNAVEVEGFDVGTLEGFSFRASSSGAGEDDKLLRSAATQALSAEISKRANLFCTSAQSDLELVCRDGLLGPQLHWNGAPVAELTKGEEPLAPRFRLIGSSLLQGDEAARVLAHAQDWLAAQIRTDMLSLALLKDEFDGKLVLGEDDVALSGLARGIAFQLYENLGILPRRFVEQEMRQVDQEARKGLWRFKVRIGASNLFVPFILKPAPTRLRLILWALYEGHESLPETPTPGMVWVEMDKSAPKGFYRMAGFQPAGGKAVRVDMVERLADAVRPLGQDGKSFEVTPEVMGLVGLSGEDFAAVMRAIGYKWTIEKTEPEAKPETEEKAAESASEAESNEPVTRYLFSWQGGRKTHGGRGAGKPAPKKGKGQRKSPPKGRGAPKAKQTKEIDKNSPFAALASLKESMSKK